jgi:geranylgeranyl diphosphate synthase, type II
MGKPIGRDAALGRPSIVAELGAVGAIRRFDELVQGVLDSIPPCPGAGPLRALMLLEARRLLPDKLARRAA